jgi:hypothetical protein
MIRPITDRFVEVRPDVEASFKADEPESYQDILKRALGIVQGDIEAYDYIPGTEICGLDVSKIHEINDGGYQGTLVFIIPQMGYQPSDYYYTQVYYGSCSGCDTLQSIQCRRDWESNGVTDQQAKEYADLALHMLQRLRKMYEEEE